MKLVNTADPFYKPLWRRVAIVTFVALWTAYELFITKDALWMTLSGGILVYSVWVFLITWPKQGSSEPR